MKYFLIIIILLTHLVVTGLKAQKYQLTDSEVSFYSEAPLEDIEAFNTESRSIFDKGSGEIAFIVPIRGFQFEKSLMQEHFNENYLESDKYPNAKFEGSLEGYQPDKSGKQQVRARGTLTIHGVSQEIEVTGTVSQQGGNISMQATFPVKVAEYDIEIPKVVFYNIAEVVEVRVKFQYQPYDS